MPSSRKAKKAIFSLIDSADVIFELGSGWGGLAVLLAKKSPVTSLYAYEISPVPWLVSKILCTINKTSNLRLLKSNFFAQDLGSADVVVCYLCPSLMKRLKLKFEKELKPGCLVISNSFAIPGWVPDKVVQLNDIWNSKIFCYVTKGSSL